MSLRSILILCGLAAALPAHAFEAVATVVNVTPINETVNAPSQRCWTEYRQTQAPPVEHNYGGAVLGGITGGLLGSLMGEGNGKVAAAAVGAGLGAITGDRMANRDNGNVATAPVQRCEQVAGTQTRTAYQVTYEFDGQRFMTQLPYHPGNQLRVNVSVTPK